jgi:hypothetical protein
MPEDSRKEIPFVHCQAVKMMIDISGWISVDDFNIDKS